MSSCCFETREGLLREGIDGREDRPNLPSVMEVWGADDDSLDTCSLDLTPG